jgi:N-acetylglutamate synthase-like GNAT family acetyltransferase
MHDQRELVASLISQGIKVQQSHKEGISQYWVTLSDGKTYGLTALFELKDQRKWGPRLCPVTRLVSRST